MPLPPLIARRTSCISTLGCIALSYNLLWVSPVMIATTLASEKITIKNLHFDNHFEFTRLKRNWRNIVNSPLSQLRKVDWSYKRHAVHLTKDLKLLPWTNLKIRSYWIILPQLLDFICLLVQPSISNTVTFANNKKGLTYQYNDKSNDIQIIICSSNLSFY